MILSLIVMVSKWKICGCTSIYTHFMCRIPGNSTQFSTIVLHMFYSLRMFITRINVPPCNAMWWDCIIFRPYTEFKPTKHGECEELPLYNWNIQFWNTMVECKTLEGILNERYIRDEYFNYWNEIIEMEKRRQKILNYKCHFFRYSIDLHLWFSSHVITIVFLPTCYF